MENLLTTLNRTECIYPQGLDRLRSLANFEGSESLNESIRAFVEACDEEVIAQLSDVFSRPAAYQDVARIADDILCFCRLVRRCLNTSDNLTFPLSLVITASLAGPIGLQKLVRRYFAQNQLPQEMAFLELVLQFEAALKIAERLQTKKKEAVIEILTKKIDQNFEFQ